MRSIIVLNLFQSIFQIYYQVLTAPACHVIKIVTLVKLTHIPTPIPKQIFNAYPTDVLVGSGGRESLGPLDDILNTCLPSFFRHKHTFRIGFFVFFFRTRIFPILKRQYEIFLGLLRKTGLYHKITFTAYNYNSILCTLN